jgi:peptidoglycan-associated lipoprotein
MKTMMLRITMLLAVLALATGTVGCAKKAVEAPPAPPAPPPTEEPAPPAPAPPPATEEPAPAPLQQGDLQPVFFDFDSDALTGSGRATLDANAKLLRDNPTAQITIEGHCDERGTVEYNLALGERRAQSARDYLVNAGIDAARIQLISYGKERPFDPGHTEEAWDKNRRAHFVLRS